MHLVLDKLLPLHILSNIILLQSGTCKMGPIGDETAVVTPRLKVQGIRSLRVADASIMPRIPAAHTHAPVVMVAEKAADMIKEDWDEPHHVMSKPLKNQRNPLNKVINSNFL